MGAFGTTEKRFLGAYNDAPGPGEYHVNNDAMNQSFNYKRVKGKNLRVRS